MDFFTQAKRKLKFWLIIVAIILFFLSWTSNNTKADSQGDLLWQLIEPAYDRDLMIQNWKTVDTEWNVILKWSTVIGWGYKPSIIVRITKLLLSITIALSITMILYNGMVYIIQTWQWKESKDLTKNIAYIVIWILIALFSVVFITLLQSVPQTLEKDLKSGIDDYEVVE